MTGRIFFAVVAVLAIPGAAAAFFGTEEQPELPPSGPPAYWEGHSGSRDHDYLEIVAGWFSYDNVTDEIAWTLKTVEGTGYASPNADWWIGCVLQGNVTLAGDVQGQLRYSWFYQAEQGGQGSNVSFIESTTGSTTFHAIPYSFEGDFGEPAFFRFNVARNELLAYGEAVTDFRGECAETYAPQTSSEELTVVTGLALKQVAANRALSESVAIYSFTHHQRIRGPEGELDPIEEFERSQATATTESAASATNATPALGAAAAMIALLVLTHRVASGPRQRR